MVLPFCLFTLLPLSAQTFTQRLQKSGRGEGTITIHQSQAIDNLVNGPKQEQPKKPVVTTPEENKTTTAPEKSNTAKKEEAKEATKDVAKEATNDTVSIINIGRPHKIIGYRVQAFAGGSSRRDKQKAEQTASAIKQMFPSESVYTQYDNPRWTCRVGNFRTREEAKAMLSEIRKLGFNSANIIKTRVTVYD
ncbi:MAG: SPOR domain-containing protein [Prevotella sp.]|nr:SPOR domain-containing protein [Prevotella sp.]